MDIAKFESELNQYRQELEEVILLLNWADSKLANVPPIFHSATYSTGVWQTRVDLGVAIENFKRLVEFLSRIDRSQLSDSPIIIENHEDET